MYFWNSYPFVRLAIVLILGILFFDAFPVVWNHALPVGAVLLTLCLAGLVLSVRFGFYTLRHYNGVMALLLLFLIGGEVTRLRYHHYPVDHYSNIEGRVDGFSGIVVAPVNERTNHFRYDLELTQAHQGDSTFQASGLIHVYVRKDSAENQALRYGDHLLIKGSFFEVPVPYNPHEFDYKKYLQRKGIYRHAFVKNNEVKVVKNDPPNAILAFAFQTRKKAALIIDRHIPEPDRNGIAKALLLGIKDHLDNEVKRSYSSAGAMHVLAVSGLHVGIIYLLLRSLLAGLRTTHLGRKLFGIISITAIWLYATITGLSPSVLRAATMFSVVVLSEMWSREGNIYNTLGFAAFLLLVVDPYLIYSVGFQLSFAAVFGIVYLQPKLYRLLEPGNIVLEKVWAITCVSMAAQMATFPLSAYYFHQFPTYFLISNLVVIPAATVMLVGGISMLVLDPIIRVAGAAIGFLLSAFIGMINRAIAFVEQLPGSLVEWLYLDQVTLILTYGIILTLIWGLHHRSFKTLIICSVMVILLSGWMVQENKFQARKHQLVFYEISGKLAIDHIKGHRAWLYVDEYEENELELLAYQINPNRLSSHLRPIDETIKKLPFPPREALLPGIIATKRILVIDSTTFHLDFKEKIKTDILVIENQSVKSLKWLKENMEFDYLLIGNKNPSFFSRRIKEQAKELDIVIHSLKEDGAFSIDL